MNFELHLDNEADPTSATKHIFAQAVGLQSFADVFTRQLVH